MTITNEERKDFALNMDKMCVLLEDINSNEATPEKLNELNQLFKEIQEPLMATWEAVKEMFLPMMDAMVVWFDNLPDDVKQLIETYSENLETEQKENCLKLTKEEIVDCTYFETWEAIQQTFSLMDPCEIEQHLTHYQSKMYKEITHDWNRWASEEIFSFIEGDKLNAQTT